MPSFGVEVPHSLGREKAIERLKNFLDRIVEHYKEQVSKLDGEWNDNVLSFQLKTFGMTLTGTLTVENDVARVEGQLPFAAVAFRGKIQDSIREELERELGKA